MTHRILLIAFVGAGLLAHAQSKSSGQAAAPTAGDPTPSAAAAIEKRVEEFLRNVYAWGSDFEVKVGPVKPAPASGFYEVPVSVGTNGQSDSAIVYVSKDGRYMFRGEIQDMNSDPLAATRQQLHLDGFASKGPADAKIVLVEFADFECPACRQLDAILRPLLQKSPGVRLVFKDFPIEQLHPWAMTAALAGRCVLQTSSEAFWKFHDAVYDSQDLISPENAYNKLKDIAEASGVKDEQFQTCMADPKTADAVHRSVDEGHSLQISATPTTFVNGRRFVGPDEQSLQQFIQFDTKRIK